MCENMDNVDFIDKYLSEIELICKDISKKDIESFINLLYDAWKEDKHIFIAGNGGSASTATHFASDLNRSIFYL